jgi:hypothetical protein
MKKILLVAFQLFLFNLLPAIIYAQGDYRQGYIITNSQDTIKGYLRYTAYGSKECSFKKNLTDNIVVYTVNDLLGFRFNEGKYYVSKDVIIDKVNEKLFIEYLIKGRANIYYTRFLGDHYFLEKENEKLVELTENDSIVMKKNKDGDGVVPIYKQKRTNGKLKYTFRDCPQVYSEIDRLTTLTHPGLIKLAKDYHEKTCTTEQCIVFESKVKPIRVNLGVFIGSSTNNLNFGDRLITDTRMEYNLGIRTEFANIINWSEHTSLTIDFSIQRLSDYKFTKKVNSFETGDGVIKYNGQNYRIAYPSVDLNPSFYQTSVTIDLKALVLKVPILFNQSFYLGKTRPYIGAGMQNMFIPTQNKDFVYDLFYKEYGKSIPSYLYGFIGQAGVKYELKNNHSLFFELNYENNISPHMTNYLRLHYTSCSFALGYSL